MLECRSANTAHVWHIRRTFGARRRLPFAAEQKTRRVNRIHFRLSETTFRMSFGVHAWPSMESKKKEKRKQPHTDRTTSPGRASANQSALRTIILLHPFAHSPRGEYALLPIISVLHINERWLSLFTSGKYFCW